MIKLIFLINRVVIFFFKYKNFSTNKTYDTRGNLIPKLAMLTSSVHCESFWNFSSSPKRICCCFHFGIWVNIKYNKTK